MRVAAIDRPRLFEQFWRMGLAKNLGEWQDAMRMQQLPLFHTAYADRDGHIAYVDNATLWAHKTGDYRFWQGVVPGDKSELIATTIQPYDAIPKVIDPPTGWVQNSNDMPWTSVYPMMLDSTKFAAGFAAPQGITQRAQCGIRILSTAPAKMTFEGIKKWKLSTRVEPADQFVDEIVSTAKAMGTDRAKLAADVLAKLGSRGGSRKRWHAALLQVHDRCRPELRLHWRFQSTDRRPASARDAARFQRSSKGNGDARHRGWRSREGIRLAQRQVGRCHAVPPRQRRPSRQRRAVAAGRDSHDWRRTVCERQDPSGLGRHVLRRDRVLDAAAR
jgi:hypothetical protein